MTKVTCAFAEARISKENSVVTVMWIQVFVKSGEGLGQAVSPHAGELSVGEQRGGFQWLTPHVADPYTFLVVVWRSYMSISGTVCFVVPFVRPL